MVDIAPISNRNVFAKMASVFIIGTDIIITVNAANHTVSGVPTFLSGNA